MNFLFKIKFSFSQSSKLNINSLHTPNDYIRAFNVSLNHYRFGEKNEIPQKEFEELFLRFSRIIQSRSYPLQVFRKYLRFANQYNFSSQLDYAIVWKQIASQKAYFQPHGTIFAGVLEELSKWKFPQSLWSEANKEILKLDPQTLNDITLVSIFKTMSSQGFFHETFLNEIILRIENLDKEQLLDCIPFLKYKDIPVLQEMLIIIVESIDNTLLIRIIKNLQIAVFVSEDLALAVSSVIQERWETFSEAHLKLIYRLACHPSFLKFTSLNIKAICKLAEVQTSDALKPSDIDLVRKFAMGCLVHGRFIHEKNFYNDHPSLGEVKGQINASLLRNYNEVEEIELSSFARAFSNQGIVDAFLINTLDNTSTLASLRAYLTFIRINDVKSKEILNSAFKAFTRISSFEGNSKDLYENGFQILFSFLKSNFYIGNDEIKVLLTSKTIENLQSQSLIEALSVAIMISFYNSNNNHIYDFECHLNRLIKGDTQSILDIITLLAFNAPFDSKCLDLMHNLLRILSQRELNESVGVIIYKALCKTFAVSHNIPIDNGKLITLYNIGEKEFDSNFNFKSSIGEVKVHKIISELLNTNYPDWKILPNQTSFGMEFDFVLYSPVAKIYLDLHSSNHFCLNDETRLSPISQAKAQYMEKKGEKYHHLKVPTTGVMNLNQMENYVRKRLNEILV